MELVYVDIHTHAPREGVLSPTMAGVHPWDADKGLELPSFDECDIIGETGLDFACEATREAQMSLFERHLQEAELRHKPVVLHVVRSFEEVISVLRKYELQGVVFHGFIGSKQQAARCIERGYCLSFGHRSLRSPRTREVIKWMPVGSLFCETDDQPRPSIEQIYDEVATLRGISREELAARIYDNYVKLFER
ncbi:MAG: TatD family hydrolase [Alistipes sp.]|nr:TatD family hydrolase [Alistipes sp.]